MANGVLTEPLYLCDMEGNEAIQYKNFHYTLGEWAESHEGKTFQKHRARKPNLLKKTGRTRRMLDQAIDEAMAGETVYVICHDARHAHDLWSMVRYRNLQGWHNIDEHGRTIGLGMKTDMDRGGRIHFVTARNSQFDWKFLHFTNGMIGIIHIDHYAIEQRLHHLLKEMHRYDPETDQGTQL